MDLIKVGDKVKTKFGKQEFIVGIVEQDKEDPNLQWIWSEESKAYYLS